jgi:large subunit ribosomal protein L19
MVSSNKLRLSRRIRKMNPIIQELEASLIKPNLPKVDIGDTVKVFVKIKEGGKERTQGYEGVVIKRHGSGISATITVRRVFQGIGIERVFLIHSPRVEKVTVQRRGHVRRAKLYYLRQRTGKATRIKERVGTAKDVAANASAKAANAAAAAAPAPAAASAPAAPETT